MTGVEPACEAWEASILPLYYIRIYPDVDRSNIPRFQSACKKAENLLIFFDRNRQNRKLRE